MDIGLLIPATIPQVIAEVVDTGMLRPSTIPLVIVDNILVEVSRGNKRPATLPLSIREKELELKGEVDTGLRLATIPIITKTNVVYF